MWILENIEAREERGETRSSEYVVEADHHFVGDWKWKGYHLRLWELEVTKGPGEKRRLNLRVEYGADLFRDSWKSATTDAYYHGGGLADEVVSLASLFLRARLSLGPRVRSDDRPEWIELGYSSPVDPGLLRGKTDLGELDDWFPLVEGLAAHLWQPFMLSVRLYHQAIEMIATNPDLAYLTLVSAVEVLAQDHPVGEVALEEIDEGLARAVDRVEPAELGEEIRRRIIRRQYFTKR